MNTLAFTVRTYWVHRVERICPENYGISIEKCLFFEIFGDFVKLDTNTHTHTYNMNTNI